jgi:membrane associated rhomboid family serine protease
MLAIIDEKLVLWNRISFSIFHEILNSPDRGNLGWQFPGVGDGRSAEFKHVFPAKGLRSMPASIGVAGALGTDRIEQIKTPMKNLKASGIREWLRQIFWDEIWYWYMLLQGGRMRTGENAGIALSCVALLWGIYVIGLVLPLDLRNWGIHPREVHGLYGLLFAPFLHNGIRHLLANSLALVILLTISLMYSRKLTAIAILIMALAGGGAIWLFGASHTVHIGASGIIFGLIGYLLAIGIFRHELPALLVSLIVLAYYGWTLLSLFVVSPGISWSGHFFGFLSGIQAAWLTRGENRRSLSRKWEKHNSENQ